MDRSKDLHVGWNKLNKVRFLTLMPMAMMSIRLGLYPLQVVRTRLQFASNTPYRGTIHALRTIFAKEGMRALYKGFAVNSLTLLASPLYTVSLEYGRRCVSVSVGMNK
jgi:hypothetical protein